jgi:hypothetical protein
MKLMMRRKGARMNLTDFHVFEKKWETPFRMPGHIRELINRIESENRENYPNIFRYMEILADAKPTYAYLNSIVAPKEHAKEARKIRETLGRELAKLSDKIVRNMQ